MLSTNPYIFKKVHFVDTLSRRTYFWETTVQCRLENSLNEVQLNPIEDKYYLLTPYPKTNNRPKFTKTRFSADFSDKIRQNYSGYFKDIKNYKCLNVEKYCPLDISSIKNLVF